MISDDLLDAYGPWPDHVNDLTPDQEAVMGTIVLVVLSVGGCLLSLAIGGLYWALS